MSKPIFFAAFLLITNSPSSASIGVPPSLCLLPFTLPPFSNCGSGVADINASSAKAKTPAKAAPTAPSSEYAFKTAEAPLIVA